MGAAGAGDCSSARFNRVGGLSAARYILLDAGGRPDLRAPCFDDPDDASEHADRLTARGQTHTVAELELVGTGREPCAHRGAVHGQPCPGCGETVYLI